MLSEGPRLLKGLQGLCPGDKVSPMESCLKISHGQTDTSGHLLGEDPWVRQGRPWDPPGQTPTHLEDMGRQAAQG